MASTHTITFFTHPVITVIIPQTHTYIIFIPLTYSYQGLSTQSLPESSVAVVLEVTAATMKIPISSVAFGGVTFTSSRKLSTGDVSGGIQRAVVALAKVGPPPPLPPTLPAAVLPTI